MHCTRLVWIILLQLCCLCCLAQQSSSAFIRITTRQGLSQGHVNSILKDQRGFMWFATDGGLNRFDGYAFQIFKNVVDESSSISNDIVYDIAEDRAGNLWAGTGSGLDQFDRNKETFTHYNPGHDITVNDVLIDARSNIWLGTTEGLFLFNPGQSTFKQYRHSPTATHSLSDDHIYHLTEDNTGLLWIATKNGLNAFDPARQRFTVYAMDKHNPHALQTNWIRSVFKDHAGVIWVGTIGSGIARFDAASGQFQQYKNDPVNPFSISNNDVLSFTEDHYHQLWVGTENGGINLLNRQTGQFTSMVNDAANPESLSNNSVYALYTDDIGNVWAGTWSNGLSMLPAVGKKFRRFTRLPGNANSLSNASVLTIACDARNDVWIGTDGGGINRFKPATGQFTHYLHDARRQGTIQNDFAITVINAGTNLLAIGYHRGGVDLFNTNTGKVVKHLTVVNPRNKPFELSVNCLFRDVRSNLWVGTWGGGLLVFDSNYRMIADYHYSNAVSNGINNDFINCITADKAGNVWIGTSKGINLFHPQRAVFTQYLQGEGVKGISNNEVNQVFEDSKGRIWIATMGGLDLYNPSAETFTSFKEQQGLPSSSIQSILEDKRGVLWVATYNGLAAFDPDSKKCRNYNMDDGLQGPEFKNNCSFKSGDGRLFFGGTDGFNYFHPDSLQDNRMVPPVYITSFQLFNKSQQPGNPGTPLKQTITETKTISLSYKQNVITFGFAALNYTYSENNEYAYMLEGFDDAWVYAGKQRTASYTNLNPGVYTFRVKASNNAGIWNERGASLQLIIRPPFWKTWWFISLCVLTSSGLIIAWYNYRMARIKAQKKHLEQQVQLQTEALVQLNKEETSARIAAEQARKAADEANDKLQISNREMEQFAYVASHDLSEPLRTTRNFVQLLQARYKGRLDEKADQYIYFINDASQRMQVLIKDLLEFSRIGGEKTVTHVDCNELLTTVLQDIAAMVNENNALVTSTPLPVINGYATELKLLFQNLLVNAIKFRKKEQVPTIHISAVEQEKHWQLAFSDNGIGIEPEFQEKIFLIFQRLHSMRDYAGSGIGLAHCQKIAALHNGKIWVQSTPGEGSTFFVTLRKDIGQQSIAVPGG